jgi:hypothetical protein
MNRPRTPADDPYIGEPVVVEPPKAQDPRSPGTHDGSGTDPAEEPLFGITDEALAEIARNLKRDDD